MIQSKIKIDLDGHRRPCISVFQAKDIEEPVDKLLKMFIEDLRHTSKTLTISFDGISENGYNATILPISDEISYFRERLTHLMSNGKETIHANQSKLIDDFLFWIQNPDISSYIKTNGVVNTDVSDAHCRAGQQNIQG